MYPDLLLCEDSPKTNRVIDLMYNETLTHLYTKTNKVKLTIY